MTSGLTEKIKKLPASAGAYIFKDDKERVIYVGKAKNVKKRVLSHFSRPDQHIIDFTSLVADVDFILANNENEALLLESQLIKKFQPRYNVMWKDDKDYFFVGQTREKFPRPAIIHRLENYDREKLAGPFMQGGQLRSYLRELRKLFPFRTCSNMPKKICMYEGLGLCPAPCRHPRQTKRYKKSLVALRAMLKLYQNGNLRVEGYDISNLSGTLAVGSMVVFEHSKPDKNEYRKFKIKRVKGQNDVASLREVLLRRLRHDEWRKPDLILLDGGKGQLKAVRGIDIPAVALAKFKRSGGKLFSPFSKTCVKIERLPDNVRNILLQARDEAHRFAISYNKLRRKKKILADRA